MRRIFLALSLLLGFVCQAQQLTIVSSNVENLLADSAGYEQKLALTAQMMADKGADIYCLQEVQPMKSTVNDLLSALNARSSSNYVAVNIFDKSTYYHQSLFIYNAGKVETVGSSTSPYSSGIYNCRMRIQQFKDLSNGETFVLSNNHFKSYNEPKTLENAQELVTKLATVSDPRIMIVGDLNSELTDDPCQYLVNAGYVEEVESRYPSGYSYYYRGSYQYIDHCFTSAEMSKCVMDAKAWNVNIGSKAKYGYSDHEPLFITIALAEGGSTDPNPTDPNPTEPDETISPDSVIAVSIAYDLCSQLASRELSTQNYTVRGVVQEVTEQQTQYGNITFVFTDGKQTMTGYRLKGPGNTSITESDFLSIGDTVIVYGQLQNYYGTMEVCKGYVKEVHPYAPETDAIETMRVVADDEPLYYNLQGQLVALRQRGVYIRKTSRGTQKTIVR